MRLIFGYIIVGIVICASCSNTQSSQMLNSSIALDTSYCVQVYNSKLVKDSMYFTCQPNCNDEKFDTLNFEISLNSIGSIVTELNKKGVISDTISAYLQNYGFIDQIRYSRQDDSIIIQVADFYEDEQIYAMMRSKQDTLISNSMRRTAMRIPKIESYDKLSPINRCDTLCQGFLWSKYGFIEYIPQVRVHYIKINNTSKATKVQYYCYYGNVYIFIYSNSAKSVIF